MEHLNDIEILAYIGGDGDAQQQRRVTDHISVCNECAKRHDEMLRTWDALGEWTIDTAGRDISDSVLRRARQPDQHRNRKLPVGLPGNRFIAAAFRIAASIIIAVTIGAMAGARSANRELSAEAGITESPNYLAALSLQWSSDLNWSVLEEHEHDSEVD